MFVLFEETGKFLAGRILSESDASLQVELDSGKRVKVKAANALLKFEKPAPAELVAAGQQLSADIELDLAWEFASEEEFGFADLARDYFSSDASKPASLEQQAAALFRLFESPHYFRRAGRAASRKRRQKSCSRHWSPSKRKSSSPRRLPPGRRSSRKGNALHRCASSFTKSCSSPTRTAPNTRPWSRLHATRTSHRWTCCKSRRHCLALPVSLEALLFENFPKGTAFPALQAPEIKDELPLADVKAFSIDDSATTEIDDALSVQGLGSGTVTLGIHIAAPGLAVLPGSAIDAVGRARLSTVYMPGYKLTMLPDEIVKTYTLLEGRNCPALSLYLTLDEATFEIKASATRLEQVPIVSNLRHDKLDSVFTEAFLRRRRPARRWMSSGAWNCPSCTAWPGT